MALTRCNTGSYANLGRCEAVPQTKIDSARIKKIYDHISPSYDRREAILDFFLFRRHRKQICAQASGNVLEIGIGTGKNLHLYKENCQITGIDISTGMLDIAERRAKRLHKPIRLMHMDAHELNFPDQHFNSVVSTLSLCTVVDPIAVLGEIARVTKPGGRILLLEHGRSGKRILSKMLDRWTPHQVRRFGCHPNRNILALVQAANLQIVHSQRYIFGMIYNIECAVSSETKPLKHFNL